MVAYSVGHEFEEIGLSVLDDIIPGESSSLKHCQGVIAVDPAAGDSVGDCLADDAVRCVLILKASRDGVFVVPEQEEGLALQSSCEVEGSWEVAFTCSALAEVASGHFLLLCHSKSVA